MTIQEERHCPICGESVTKVTESDRDIKTRIKCQSEYFIHYADDKLIKVKNPKDLPVSETDQA